MSIGKKRCLFIKKNLRKQTDLKESKENVPLIHKVPVFAAVVSTYQAFLCTHGYHICSCEFVQAADHVHPAQQHSCYCPALSCTALHGLRTA